jgi:hypothetical protein
MASPKLSRRGFLKVSALTLAPFGLAAGRLSPVGAPSAAAQRTTLSVQPQALEGRWLRLGDDNFTQVMAVHSVLLHTGHILYFSGDETDVLLHNQRQQDKRYDYVRLFDCNSHEVLPCAYPSTDLFCGGHAKLADGRVVVAGGIQRGIFTPQSEGTAVEFFKHNLGKSHRDHPLGSNSAWVIDPLSRCERGFFPSTSD